MKEAQAGRRDHFDKPRAVESWILLYRSKISLAYVHVHNISLLR